MVLQFYSMILAVHAACI